MEFKIVNGQLERDDQAPIGLTVPPDFFTPTFLKAMFNTPVEFPGAPHDLCARLDADGRLRLAEVCGGDPGLTAQWIKAASEWSTVAAPQGRWLIEQLSIIYRADAKTAVIDRIMVDVKGRRFVVCADDGRLIRPEILSWREFEFRYGQTVPDHLTAAVAVMSSRFAAILEEATSKVVARERDLINTASGERRTFTLYGLQGVEIERWERPAGWNLAP